MVGSVRVYYIQTNMLSIGLFKVSSLQRIITMILPIDIPYIHSKAHYTGYAAADRHRANGCSRHLVLYHFHSMDRVSSCAVALHACYGVYKAKNMRLGRSPIH
jgi:hypothetical protein